jgi:hypothetical protein
MCRVAREMNIDGADMVTTYDLPPDEATRRAAKYLQDLIRELG